MKPTLKIEFRNGEGVYFFKQPNTDHAVGYELYRVLLNQPRTTNGEECSVRHREY
jgi:hypothetical protein